MQNNFFKARQGRLFIFIPRLFMMTPDCLLHRTIAANLSVSAKSILLIGRRVLVASNKIKSLACFQKSMCTTLVAGGKGLLSAHSVSLFYSMELTLDLSRLNILFTKHWQKVRKKVMCKSFLKDFLGQVWIFFKTFWCNDLIFSCSDILTYISDLPELWINPQKSTNFNN